MKVKVGDTWYDAKNTPCCVVFSEAELAMVKQMTPETAPNRRVISGEFSSREAAIEWANEGFKGTE